MTITAAELGSLQLLRAIDEGVAGKTGTQFFPQLVRSLAQALGGSSAFVSRILHDTYEAQVLAIWKDGEFIAPFSYPLGGTPCECVLDNQIVTFGRNVQDLFPADREGLEQFGAQSFLAIPLCDEHDHVIGHLAVIDRRERDWSEADIGILRIFSSRAGAELLRREYEQRLEAANAALHQANAQLRREVTQRLDTEEQLASTAARSNDAAELVRTINSGISAKTGTDFFQELVRSLAAALSATVVFISQIDTVAHEANMLAIWVHGALGTPQRFNLSATPCESILDGGIAAFPRRVHELFPGARDVIDQLGTKSYLASPILDDEAHVIGHIAVQDQQERDWTQTDFGILRLFANRAAAELKRKEHEQRVANANTQLQRLNAALRREVTVRISMEEQLAGANRAAEEARRAAEAANLAKSNFLAHMSHELRTPLNGILGYAQLMKNDGTLGLQQLDNVAVIERSGEHLLTLINELLDLAKIEAGRLEILELPLNLPQLLSHVADLASVRAAQGDLTFRAEIDAGLPRFVKSDERALRQVLLNLLGNAVKFTQSGSVAFRAIVLGQDEGGFALRFEVEDTGPGIAPADVQRIFEPFVRGENEQRVEGTGLGLAITKRLVEAMGGTLEVKSQPGIGTVFALTVHLAGAGHVDVAERKGRITGYHGVRRRVLVVDNDAANRTLLSRILGGLGFDTLEAPEGRSALELAENAPPDLIVTDLAMPVMSGMELAARVREHSTLQRLPVLALSASTSQYTREEAIAAGCDDFLPKPIQVEALLDRVGRLLHLAWRRAEPIVCESEVSPSGGAPDEARAEAIWVAELYDLAMQGDVKELLTRTARAVAQDPPGKPVYAEVQRLTRKFDLKGVRRLLHAASGKHS